MLTRVLSTQDETSLKQEITRYVEEHKAPYKWLRGGIDFVDKIPKSPSGKILRRLLRDLAKGTSKSGASKL